MKKAIHYIPAFFLLLFGPIALVAGDTLNNNEVRFTGTVLSLLENGEGGGTIFVSVNQTELRVIVNPKTEIEDKDGKEIDISSVKKDAAVQITGKFSSSGILASEIMVLSPAPASNTFRVCGHITGISAANSTFIVEVVGITVVVTGTTKIDWDGTSTAAASLRIGLEVCVNGSISGTTWTATEIYIHSNEKRMDKVRFEGTIAKINMVGGTIGSIEFAVTGTAVNGQVVKVGPSTRIFGTPAVGALAEVKGVLNSDLSIAASQVHVLPALEIKPDERKMKVGQTATFTVKLRETAVADVTVGLAADKAGVISGLPSTVKVLAGSKTAEFSVKAETVDTVKVTATLQIQTQRHTATTAIYVGTLSDDDTERPDKEHYMAFAPSHMKMGMNDVREVVLLIKPPQETLPSVTFTFDTAVLDVTKGKDLGDGAAGYKVTIKSKTVSTLPTTKSVTATSSTGAKAELLVTIEDRK